MKSSIEQDAQEYGAHVRGGDWRLGLLVARNVEKGRNDAKFGAESPGAGDLPDPEDRKISIVAFAAKAKVGKEKVGNHLNMWEKAAAAGLVPAASGLNPGDGEEIDLPDPELVKDYYTSVSGGDNGGKDRKATLAGVIDRTDKLSAEDRAKVANILVAQPEVVEQIVQSGEMALDPYLDLATEAFKQSKDESKRKAKTIDPTHAAVDAEKEIAQATRHLRAAQYEIIQWRVERKHDLFRLLEGSLDEAKAIIEAIEEIFDAEMEPSA